jgi:hypothetical protein
MRVRAGDCGPAFSLGGYHSSMKSCPYCGGKYPDDAVICPVDGNALQGPNESRNKASRPLSSTVLCPVCGAADCYARTIELRSSFSWLAFFAGGIFAVLARNAGRPTKVRCTKCEALFEIRTPLSKVWLVIFWILVCPTVIALIIMLVDLLGGFGQH